MNNEKSLLDIIIEKKAMIFDLFHTLTVLDHKGTAGPGTSEMLGIDREKWNKQLIKKSPERLKGKLKDPYEIIRRMARACNPDLPEDLIEKATENRIKNFGYSLLYIPEENTNVLKRLKNMNKKIGVTIQVFIIMSLRALAKQSPFRLLRRYRSLRFTQD